MAKQETNFMEILLRNLMIGMTIYNDDGTPIIIEELNYDPIIKHVFIRNGDSSYKLRMDKNYDFEVDNVFSKIMPNKHKIVGKRDR
jgi:hypothetical protein